MRAHGVLDVVYNHCGREGNYLDRHARVLRLRRYAVGTSQPFRIQQVRAYVIENALHWVKRYRFDGLRVDAVDAIVGQPSILNDLSRAVEDFAAATRRMIHLVLENDDDRARLLDPRTTTTITTPCTFY